MLLGKNVVVRTLDSGDLDFARALRNEPRVNRWFIDRHFINDFQQQTFFRVNSESKASIFFVVELRSTNEKVGVVMIQGIDHRNQRASVGHFYTESTPAIAIYEACYLTSDYAFEYLNLRKLTAEVVTGNTRASRFSESIGMIREAHKREHVFSHGRMRDVDEFALFRDEFMSRPTPIVAYLRKLLCDLNERNIDRIVAG